MDGGGGAGRTVRPEPDPATPAFEGFEQPVEMGRGGFGIVYKAWQPALRRHVAIKVPNAFKTDKRTLRGFMREAAAMGSLSDSPHVVVPYGADVLEDGTPFLLLPWLDGGSLQDRIYSGPLPWRHVLDIAVKLAGALEDAHAKGVLHLDVKPENVLFTSRGEPQLADFGIARLEEVGHLQTQTQAFTTLFAAPELWTDGTISPLVDIYSLGATIYAAVNGEPAFFESENDPSFQIQHRVVKDPLPALGDDVLPGAMWQVLRRAMEKRSAQRFQSATRLRQALQSAQRILGVEVTDLGSDRPMVDAPGLRPSEAYEEASEARPPRARRRQPRLGTGDRSTTKVRVGVPAVVAGFTGRDDALALLEHQLDAGGAPATVGLVGLGGSGKSQLAAKYVRDHDPDVEVVLWAPAESDPRPPFAELGTRLGLNGDDLPTRAAAAKAWLGETDRSWLLVLDNVPGVDVIREWVPATGAGRVIVTSRSHSISALVDVVTVNVFDFDTATDFLLERTGSTNNSGARAVAAALGGLPLAMGHAAAYCRSTNIGFDAYLSLLTNLPTTEMFGDSPAGAHEATIASTWEPSVDAADAKVAGAKHVLDVAAHLAPDAIPLELLAPRSTDPIETKHRIDRVGALVDFSLITVDGDERFLVHRLVQKVIGETHDQPIAPAAVDALDRIRAAWPDGTDRPETWPACQALLPHLDHVADDLDEPGEHAERLVEALNRASFWLHRASPDYVEHASRTVERGERLLGDDHPETLKARDRLASSYQWAGRNAEAIPIFEQVLADSERIAGIEATDILDARANLAASYQAAGRTEEAMAIKERVVEDSEALLGDEHADTLMAKTNLAISYQAAGRIEEAIAIQEQVVVDTESLLGDDHLDTVMARADLATSYRAVGRINEAIAIEERVVADAKRLVGEDHVDTLNAQVNLATSYRVAGRDRDSIAILEGVVRDAQGKLGPTHRVTLLAKSELMAIHQAQEAEGQTRP